MPLSVYRTTKYPFESHEEKLIEYHAIVNDDASINQGGAGLTISRTSAGIYQIVINDIHPIYAADLANTSLASSENGTGVTKTCSLFANTITEFPITDFCFGFAEKLELNASGQLQFRVKTVEGGALTDHMFSVKAIVTCSAYGRN